MSSAQREYIGSLTEGEVFLLGGKRYIKVRGDKYRPYEQPEESIPRKPPYDIVERPDVGTTLSTSATAKGFEHRSAAGRRGGSEFVQIPEQRSSASKLPGDGNDSKYGATPDRHVSAGLGRGSGNRLTENRPDQGQDARHSSARRYVATEDRDPGRSQYQSLQHDEDFTPFDIEIDNPRTGLSQSCKLTASSKVPQPSSAHDERAAEQRHTSKKPDATGETENIDQKETTFTVLSSAAGYLASIPQHDIEQRAGFISDNLDSLLAKLDDFLREAVEQILDHDIDAALRCLQSLVELNMCRRIKQKYVEAEVLDMHKKGTEQNGTYKKMFDNVRTEATRLAKAKAAKARAEPQRQETTSVQHKKQDLKLDPSSYDPRLDEFAKLKISRDLGYRNAEDLLDGISKGHVIPIKTEDYQKIYMNPEDFRDDQMKKLSAKYRVPGTGKFYFPGRVFSLLWHESAGEPRNLSSAPTSTAEREKAGSGDRLPPNMTLGPYGERIYSHIRRMVVIKNRDGYCWCVAINSYGGQALKKSGLTKKERDAHTIIYDSKYQATSLDREQRIAKAPIAVDMVKGETLTSASRLHYGKPYVVEWNTRVMAVGEVQTDFIPVLLAEAAAELLGDPRRSQTFSS